MPCLQERAQSLVLDLYADLSQNLSNKIYLRPAKLRLNRRKTFVSQFERLAPRSCVEQVPWNPFPCELS
jgi:hypothetical protein